MTWNSNENDIGWIDSEFAVNALLLQHSELIITAIGIFKVDTLLKCSMILFALHYSWKILCQFGNEKRRKEKSKLYSSHSQVVKITTTKSKNKNKERNGLVDVHPNSKCTQTPSHM